METHPPLEVEFKMFNMGPLDLFVKEDGPIFGDGSCLFPNIRALSRAGFSAVQVNPEGEIIRGICGALPLSAPQNSLAAEYTAFFLAGASAEPGCKYIGDCQEVLTNYNEGWEFALGTDSAFACAWKTLYRKHRDFYDNIVAVEKIKAHKSLETTINEGGDLVSFYGNAEADRLAREGADLHAPSDSDIKRYKTATKDIEKVTAHMLETLVDLNLCRAALRVKLTRLPSGTHFNVSKGKSMPLHDFIWNGRLWYCRVCLFRTHNPGLLKGAPASCRTPPGFKGLLEDCRKHELWMSNIAGGGMFLFCAKCYHYASPHPKKLVFECGGKLSAKRSSEKHYILRREHPVSHLRLSRPLRLHVPSAADYRA